MPIDIEALADEFEERPLKGTRRKKKPGKKTPLKEGRITFILPEEVHLSSEGQEVICSIKGTLKKELKTQKNRLCCGDIVAFDPQKLVIEKLQPRRSVLMRENPSHKFQNQILASNVDLLLITASALEPQINPYLIDLYILSAQRANLKPVILINKMDLLNGKQKDASSKGVEKQIKSLIEQYQALSIPVLCVSAKDLKGFKELTQVMKNQASVFSGESGVGKSSLINAIEKSSLKVGEVSSRGQKGTHTTTLSKLMPLKFGGWCLDTPGIQSLSFKNLSPQEIRSLFIELNDCGCRFSDCLHQDEAGCAIKEALEEKRVFELRLQSYYRLLKEVQS